ncbi:hypothetical protein SAMN02745115_01107 [[Eubacterium] yurii]|jgi:hypothetical protein|nr:MAG: hypothetical protein D8H95_18735 [Lachnospiraceae bacterium]SKC48230.1 hypothetical protein SAMN02745115_01107 [[Eubacterium] yurii]
MKLLKKGDIVIILLILIFSFVLLNILKEDIQAQGQKIVVTQDNKVIGNYVLNNNPTSKYIDFDFSVDGKKYKGTLETKDSKVRLHRLPEEVVPKSIHEDMSWISDSSKIIVALPVKLVISISGGSTDSEVDTISN